ncbi:hypothetical protein EDB92DRAFT_1822287 [Lactarius akahatsu]|uniref:Uncharacterized protein n=1 Tax=Lactarius akahatsu TaxID=416441 RepID=A0AAD4L5S7_9AGAM|nr:hypothetical protein EDB92DRAFT_1822287 [Lactarius akahatsu]
MPCASSWPSRRTTLLALLLPYELPSLTDGALAKGLALFPCSQGWLGRGAVVPAQLSPSTSFALPSSPSAGRWEPGAYLWPLRGEAIGTSASINEYLRVRRAREALNGPLADRESPAEGLDGDPAAARRQQQPPSPLAAQGTTLPAEGLPSRAQKERE